MLAKELYVYIYMFVKELQVILNCVLLKRVEIKDIE